MSERRVWLTARGMWLTTMTKLGLWVAERPSGVTDRKFAAQGRSQINPVLPRHKDHAIGIGVPTLPRARDHTHLVNPNMLVIMHFQIAN